MPRAAPGYLVVGLILLVFAKQIATLKTNAWAHFYRNRSGAAAVNPLSEHAGSERSAKLGTALWRFIGALLIINGLLRLLPSQ